MGDKCFIIQDPELDVVALEFLAAGAQATKSLELDGVGERFDRWTARMGDAYVRLARMLGVLPALFFSVDGSVRLMAIEQVRLASGESRRVITLPAEAAAGLAGLEPLAARSGSQAKPRSGPRIPLAKRPAA